MKNKVHLQFVRHFSTFPESVTQKSTFISGTACSIWLKFELTPNWMVLKLVFKFFLFKSYRVNMQTNERHTHTCFFSNFRSFLNYYYFWRQNLYFSSGVFSITNDNKHHFINKLGVFESITLYGVPVCLIFVGPKFVTPCFSSYRTYYKNNREQPNATSGNVHEYDRLYGKFCP